MGLGCGVGAKNYPNDKREGEKFQLHIPLKRLDMGKWLLLDINRNSYMDSPTVPLHLTLGDLETIGQIWKLLRVLYVKLKWWPPDNFK